MLEAAAFLGVLDEPDVEWLVANSKQHEFPAGSVLIRRGEPVEFLYLIVDGAFDITVLMPDERRIATLYAGELVGEMSFVDLRPPSATVTAAMNSSVLAVSKAALTGKIENDKGFGARFYKGVAVLLVGRLRAAYAIDRPLQDDPESKVELGILETRFEEIQRHLGLRPAPAAVDAKTVEAKTATKIVKG
jgi:CRP/FNR family transcriptional regulator, cyclic AMP receptor protein